MNIREAIQNYAPWNEQEAADKALILDFSPRILTPSSART